MSSKHEISGIWRGTYFYDDAEMRHPDGCGVAFELKIIQTWWQRLFGLFSATVRDDPLRGVPGDGRIHGRHRRDSMTFTKKLPEFYVGGIKPVSLRDYLQEHGQELFREIAHPPIFYTGTFDNQGAVAGTWEIPALKLLLKTAGASLTGPRCTGTFSMSKVLSDTL